ncbi:MAG: hypothetical protein RSE34_04840, partial [Brevundimonas sp.]
MLKSRLAASVALPLALVALAACGSPAETSKPEQPPIASSAPALTRDAIETAVFEAAPSAANSPTTPAAPDPAIARAQILLDRANFSPGV